MKTQTQFKNASLVSVVNGSIVIKDSTGREHTFTNASVVSVNNGTIIIESVWEPKKGELVKITGTCIDAYSIIDRIESDTIYTFGWKRIGENNHDFTKDFWLSNSQTKLSPVTPEEQKEFDDYCKSQGKIWNKETLQWEKYKWEPKDGQKYYYITLGLFLEVSWHAWNDDEIDNSNYQSGNCFKTEEEAKAKLEQIKKLLLEV